MRMPCRNAHIYVTSLWLFLWNLNSYLLILQVVLDINIKGGLFANKCRKSQIRKFLWLPGSWPIPHMGQLANCGTAICIPKFFLDLKQIRNYLFFVLKYSLKMLLFKCDPSKKEFGQTNLKTDFREVLPWKGQKGTKLLG